MRLWRWFPARHEDGHMEVASSFIPGARLRHGTARCTFWQARTRWVWPEQSVLSTVICYIVYVLHTLFSGRVEVES